jgi:protein tyrosine phosphatase (PTP) superfamily phosphohydrolase (DUF442 family)
MILGCKIVPLGTVISPIIRIKAIFIPLFVLSFILVTPCSSITATSTDNGDYRKDKDKDKDGDEGSSTNRERRVIEPGIDNFGQVTDFFYRGAQPKGDDYNRLASIGIRTVIDLRDDPKDYAQDLARRAGMKYINFPLSDKAYPPSDAASRFLTIINNRENWPVYVHCAGGRHRTGAMTAVFRMAVQGWDVNQAYEEMKKYDFYTRWGHKAIKRYVFDYYQRLWLAPVEENLVPTN